jgi:hypothetical protein
VRCNAPLENQGLKGSLFEPDIDVLDGKNLDEIIRKNCVEFNINDDYHRCPKCSSFVKYRLLFTKLPKILFIKT